MLQMEHVDSEHCFHMTAWVDPTSVVEPKVDNPPESISFCGLTSPACPRFTVTLHAPISLSACAQVPDLSLGRGKRKDCFSNSIAAGVEGGRGNNREMVHSWNGCSFQSNEVFLYGTLQFPACHREPEEPDHVNICGSGWRLQMQYNCQNLTCSGFPGCDNGVI